MEIAQVFDQFARLIGSLSPMGAVETLREVGNKKLVRVSVRRDSKSIDGGLMEYAERPLQVPTACGGVLHARHLIPIGKKNQRLPIVILHPGLAGYSHTTVLLQAALLRDGISTVVFDGRGTGENAHLERTYGYLESSDICNVITELDSISTTEIAGVGVYGLCLGGVAAVRSGEKDDRIKAIAVEGLYYHVTDVINELNPLETDRAYSVAHRLGFEPNDLSPCTICSRLRRIPVRMVWGKYDHMVPYESRIRLVDFAKAAALCVEFNTGVQQSGHVIVLGFPMERPVLDEYIASTVAFFNRHLCGRS